MFNSNTWWKNFSLLESFWTKVELRPTLPWETAKIIKKFTKKEIVTTNELSLDKEVEVLDFPGLSLVEIEKEIEHKNDSPKNDSPDVLIKTDNKEESIQNESDAKEVISNDIKKTFKPKARKISAK